MGYSIAIDGPAGAGKSTIARTIAKKMGFIYVDTGAMYRAMALFLLRRHVNPEDGREISEVCGQAEITINYRQGEQVVLLGGENVNSLIRTEEVGNMASVTSANKDVRAKLLQLQQELAASADVVMDGRDIGTCVLPDADVKIYLTASSAVRADRRYRELIAKGEPCNRQEIERKIIERDERDKGREISPLRVAPDAVRIDSSEMTIEQVTDSIMALCRRGNG